MSDQADQVSPGNDLAMGSTSAIADAPPIDSSAMVLPDVCKPMEIARHLEALRVRLLTRAARSIESALDRIDSAARGESPFRNAGECRATGALEPEHRPARRRCDRNRARSDRIPPGA